MYTNILVSDMMDITSQLSYRMKVGTSCIYLHMCILNWDGLKIRKPKNNFLKKDYLPYLMRIFPEHSADKIQSTRGFRWEGVLGIYYIHIIYIHIFVGTMKNGSVISKFSNVWMSMG